MSSPFRRQPTMSQYLQSTKTAEPSFDWARYCGFQTHSLKIAHFAALLGILFSLVRLFLWSLDDEEDRLGPQLHTLVMMVVCGLLLCAFRLRMPQLGIPFLLFNPITVYLLFHYYISPIFSIISEWPLLDTLSGQGTLRSMSPEDRQLAFVSLCLSLSFLFLLSLSTALLCWLEWVVLRALNFLHQSAKQQAEQDGYRSAYCAADPRKSGKREYY